MLEGHVERAIAATKIANDTTELHHTKACRIFDFWWHIHNFDKDFF